MRRFGISVYPSQANQQQWLNYIALSGKYGAKRVFISLLEVKDSNDPLLDKLKTLAHACRHEGMDVFIDIAPKVLTLLGIERSALMDFFANLGATGIRFDEDLGGHAEAQATHHASGLKVELNSSSGTRLLDQVLSFCGDKNYLLGCHNFYPQRYTGLSYKHFIETSKHYQSHNILNAAFVTSPSGSYGPWEINDGLCTLEMHRDLPLAVQAKHLWATGLIDDVIIGNAFASESELKALNNLVDSVMTFRVKLFASASALDRKIILEEPHYQRGDVNDYFVRSTQSRVKYKGHSFPKVPYEGNVRKGDILIGADGFGNYVGELQVALQDSPLDARKNKIGALVNEEVFLLDYLAPWQNFRFEE